MRAAHRFEPMTTENPTKRPPNDRGQGRKPIKPGELMVVVPLRMTPEQKAKLTTLGGAKWVRAKLDEQPDK